jgi:hypothetical protein
MEDQSTEAYEGLEASEEREGNEDVLGDAAKRGGLSEVDLGKID